MITVCNDAEINQLKSILLDNLNGMSTNGLLVMMDCAALLFNECKALLREREQQKSPVGSGNFRQGPSQK